MTPEALPGTDDLGDFSVHEPQGFDPEDIKQAARIYAESFAYRGMMSESAVVYGLLGYIQSLEGRSNG